MGAVRRHADSSDSDWQRRRRSQKKCAAWRFGPRKSDFSVMSPPHPDHHLARHTDLMTRAAAGHGNCIFVRDEACRQRVLEWQWLFASLCRFAERMARRRRRLRDEQALRELPERTLSDLGIGRSEISAALTGGRSIDERGTDEPL
jgi:uncharacterized protein YjiS (DUF1127 family)